MQRMFLIMIMVLALIPAQWATAASLGPARVRLLEGDISYRTPDTQEWQQAGLNTPLDDGDSLWCPSGSRVEVQLADGTLIRLDGGSQLDVLANESAFIHLHLSSGRVYLRTNPSFNDGSLQIDADDTTILPSNRTRLRIDMLPNSQEDVSIFKGSAYVEGNGNRTKVRAGEHIAMEEGHSELLGLNSPDNWEQWNMDRDRSLTKSAKNGSYLPEELNTYSDELAQNGTWISAPDYGMIWRPTIAVSADWAPYQSGRWVMRGNNNIWVAYEPWGWAPYHYGRWTFANSYGWCWVPPLRGDVYWGPGYVGWYSTGDTIAWTPLAPGEIYYGYGNYGRFGINITSVNINTSTIVYRNANHRGGMHGVHRDDFVRGRYTPRALPRDIRGATPVVSSAIPRIQPIRDNHKGHDVKPGQGHEQRQEQRRPELTGNIIQQRSVQVPELRQRFPRITPEITRKQPEQQRQPNPAPTQQPTGDRNIRRQIDETPVRATIQPAPVQVQQPVMTRPETPRNQGQHNGEASQQPRQERQQQPAPQQQQKPRKVWRVTTPDHGKDKEK